MAGSSRSLGQLTLDLVARIGGFEKGMDQAARTADKRMKEIERRASQFGKFLGAALATGAGIAANQLRQAINTMDDLSKAAQRVSLPTEQFSGLVYAGKLADVEVNTLVTSLGRLTKAQADAEKSTSEQARVFDALKIATKEADGSLRSSLDVLYDFADAFERQKGSPEIVAAGIKIFGRSFQELIPLIKDGSQGLRDAADEAEDFGQIISTETGQAAEEFNDNLSRMGMLVSGLANAVAAELLPDMRDLTGEWVASAREGDGLTRTAKDIADAIRVVVEWMREGSQVGASFRETISQVSVMAAAAKENISGIFNFDQGQIDSSRKSFLDAGRKAWDAATQGVEEQKKAKPIIFIEPADLIAQDKRAAAAMRAAAEESARLRTLAFGDAAKAGGKTKKAGKSDAERDAEQLQKAYESMNERLAEQIALFGETTEASRVRYEVEVGGLSALSAAQKDQLIAKAEQLDQMRLEDELQEAAKDRVEEETRAFEQQAEQTAQFIDDLKFEIELLGMSNIEREKAIALRYANVDAMSAEGLEIAGLVEKYERASEAAQYWDEVQANISDTFYDVVTGAESASDAIKNFLDSLFSQSVRAAADYFSEAITGMFKNSGTASGGGGGWAELFGAIFGGGRANGGFAGANQLFEVNERGFEMATVGGRDYMLTGSQPVEVTPNHALRGGGSTVNNFAFARPESPKTQTQIANKITYEQRRAARMRA